MHLTLRRATLAGLVPAVAALALTGCGSGTSSAGGSTPASGSAASTPAAPRTPSAGELYAKTRAAALGARSVRIVGAVPDDGKKGQLDLSGTLDGRNQTMKIKAPEGTSSILTVGGKMYLTAEAKFWKKTAGPAAAKMLTGKYVLTDPKDFKDAADHSTGAIIRGMFQEEKLSFLERANAKVEPVSVDGVAAWRLSQRTGSDGTALFVSADGKAHLLQVTGPKSEAEPPMRFSQWNAVPKVSAPPASRVITLPS